MYFLRKRAEPVRMEVAEMKLASESRISNARLFRFNPQRETMMTL